MENPIKMDKLKWSVLALAVVLILAAAVWKFEYKMSNAQAEISDGYQAVFLTNGQVYFGKLAFSNRSVKLSDIYYLQVTQNLQQGATETSTSQQPNIQLVKLGNELHGPQDAMYIERDKILFWENMKNDSKVVQAIQQYQSKK